MAENEERNRQLVNRFWTEIWNQGKLDVADEVVSADFLLSLPGRELHGPTGLKEWATTIRDGFPDIYFTIAQILVDGDEAAVRWTATGTHTGALLGIVPTERKITMNGIALFRIVDGKIMEDYASEDMLGLFQQLGVLPSLPPATSVPGNEVKTQPLILMPGQGHTITARDSTVTVKVSGKDTGSVWSLSHLEVPADFVSMAPPPHYHTKEEESFYILEGTITFQIGDRQVRAPAGSFIKSPRNLVHGFSNPDPVRASLLVIGSPSGIEDYLVEVYELLSEPGPVDTAKMTAIFEKYGLFIAAPPPVTAP